MSIESPLKKTERQELRRSAHRLELRRPNLRRSPWVIAHRRVLRILLPRIWSLEELGVSTESPLKRAERKELRCSAKR